MSYGRHVTTLALTAFFPIAAGSPLCERRDDRDAERILVLVAERAELGIREHIDRSGTVLTRVRLHPRGVRLLRVKRKLGHGVGCRQRDLSNRVAVIAGHTFPRHLQSQLGIVARPRQRSVATETGPARLISEVELGEPHGVPKQAAVKGTGVPGAIPDREPGPVTITAGFGAAGKAPVVGGRPHGWDAKDGKQEFHNPAPGLAGQGNSARARKDSRLFPKAAPRDFAPREARARRLQPAFSSLIVLPVRSNIHPLPVPIRSEASMLPGDARHTNSGRKGNVLSGAVRYWKGLLPVAKSFSHHQAPRKSASGKFGGTRPLSRQLEDVPAPGSLPNRHSERFGVSLTKSALTVQVVPGRPV